MALTSQFYCVFYDVGSRVFIELSENEGKVYSRACGFGEFVEIMGTRNGCLIGLPADAFKVILLVLFLMQFERRIQTGTIYLWSIMRGKAHLLFLQVMNRCLIL